VPNHTAIVRENPWWWDVLEHGPASRYARYFDVDWAAEDERGHRMLYTALTRTTKRLDIVCAGEPLPLAVPAVPAPRTPAEEESGRRFSDQDVARLAEYLAGHVRAAAPSQRWRDVLDQVAELLDGA